MTVLVGRQAPDFTSSAVLADGKMIDIHLGEFIGKKYILLIFYALNFTFVCPSELIAFHNRIAEFKKRDVEVMGISIDSQFSHFAWRNTPVDKGGIGAIDYTLVAD